jgi:Ni,Fe-hydrogenase III large subunit
MLLLELERFYNHVADLGNLCAGTAMTGLLAEGFVLKERLWQANAALTGNRQLRGLVGFGGARRSPGRAALEAQLKVVREVLAGLERFAQKYFGSASNVERLQGTGQLAREHALKLSTVGVAARASGVPTDSRFELPSELEAWAYRGLEPRTEEAGDVLARAHLRLVEARDSARLCESLLDLASEPCPSAPAVPKRASGEGFGWAEGARGEVLTYVRVEEGRLARLRVRSPSRMNWPAVALAVPGDIVPDFPVINKSFNLSYAGCDL